MGAVYLCVSEMSDANNFTFFVGKLKNASALFVNLVFQRKLAKFSISMWSKEVLNFYIIVILLVSCFCSVLWTVLCAEILIANWWFLKIHWEYCHLSKRQVSIWPQSLDKSSKNNNFFFAALPLYCSSSGVVSWVPCPHHFSSLAGVHWVGHNSSYRFVLGGFLSFSFCFIMCNLELICTTGYLTEATDGESVLFLLKHSMELTLNNLN